MRFFPEPDSSEIAPFTHAFLHMMFAHVEFERRIADLAVVITLDPGFGETKATIWSAKERPEKFDKLCSDNQSKHPGGLPEADAIVRCLDKALPLCKDRNWLAHGVWWRFGANIGAIDVHAVRIRDGEPLSREFTVDKSSGLRIPSSMLRLNSGSCSRRSSIACRANQCRPNCRSPSNHGTLYQDGFAARF